MELTEQQLKSINQLLAFNSLKPADIEAIDNALKQANLPAPATVDERETRIKQLVKLYTAQWVAKINAATSQVEFEELSKEAFEKHKNFKSLWASMRNDITNIKPLLSYKLSTKALNPQKLIKTTLQEIEAANDNLTQIKRIFVEFLHNSKDTNSRVKDYLPQLSALNQLLENHDSYSTTIPLIMGYLKLMLEEYKFIADTTNKVNNIDEHINTTLNLEKSVKAHLHASNSPHKTKLIAKIYDFKLLLHKELAIHEYSADSKSIVLKKLLFTADKAANSGQSREESKYFNKLASFLKNELNIGLTEAEIAGMHKQGSPTTSDNSDVEFSEIKIEPLSLTAGLTAKTKKKYKP